MNSSNLRESANSCRNPTNRWISTIICTFSQATLVHFKLLPFQLHFAAAQSKQLSSTTQFMPLWISQSILNLHLHPFQDSTIIHPQLIAASLLHHLSFAAPTPLLIAFYLSLLHHFSLQFLCPTIYHFLFPIRQASLALVDITADNMLEFHC